MTTGSSSPSPETAKPSTSETAPQTVTEPASAPLRGIGGEFVTFARGGSAPAFADPVVLFIQGTETAVVDADHVLQRGHWEGCPPGWPPTPRCAVSALDVVAADSRNREPTAVTTAAPQGPCLIPEAAAQPPVFDTADEVVVLQPGPRVRACANNYAVRLAVKDGSIVGVDLVLADP
jgi:hypothetical protein